MAQLPSTANITDIITSLQGLTGINQLVELSNVLKAKGYTLTGKETIVDLISIISGANLVNTATAAGATAAQILTGKEAFTNGTKVVGTMPDRAGDTVALSSSVSGTIMKLLASAGYRDGVDDYVTLTDAAFIAANILAGKTVHGLSGTATADGTASAADILTGKSAYVNGVKLTGTLVQGKQFAYGSVPFLNAGSASCNVNNLAFVPSLVFVFYKPNSGYYNSTLVFTDVGKSLNAYSYDTLRMSNRIHNDYGGIYIAGKGFNSYQQFENETTLSGTAYYWAFE
ncbi:hypothetical protein [Paenibacillus sp. KN14-4R]|uniref:hypothetical protein n=1 Tax=Paenibacillus sp. KN14-4R TaxID=3445773 RepID=UPI003F9F6881